MCVAVAPETTKWCVYICDSRREILKRERLKDRITRLAIVKDAPFGRDSKKVTSPSPSVCLFLFFFWGGGGVKDQETVAPYTIV